MGNSNLDFLPSELISHILSFDQLSFVGLKLYLCGSRVLQRKLERSITSVSLQSSLLFANRRIPKCLALFRSLSELCIKAPDIILYGPSPITEVLSQLSPTLTKLKIQLIETSLIDILPLALIQEKDPTSPPNLISRFRNIFVRPLILALSTRISLKTLILDSSAILDENDVQLLPRTLTSFTAAFEHDEALYIAIAKALPAELTQLSVLSLPAFSVQFFAALPRTLTSLTSWKETITTLEEIRHMPQSLTKLIGIEIVCLNLAAASSLPPYLTNLKVHKIDPRESESSFQALNPQMRLFQASSKVELKPSQVRALPRNLTSLNADIDLTGIESEDWPPSLTKLKGQFNGSFSSQFASSVPSTLRYLTFYGLGQAFDPASIQQLPRSITKLRLSLRSEDFDGIDYPPLLRTLQLNQQGGRGAFSMAKLPRSVTSVSLVGVILSPVDLIDLPPHLKLLAFDALVEDSSDLKDLFGSRLAKNRQILDGNKSGREALTVPEKHELLTLLPRTLDELRFSCTFLPPTAWTRAPHLTRLTLFGMIDPDVLLHIPTNRLTSITLSVVSLSETHIQALPRGLKFLSLFVLGEWQMTPHFAKYTPCHLSPAYWITHPTQSSKERVNLAIRRFIAFGLQDPSELHRLLHYDTITLQDYEDIH